MIKELQYKGYATQPSDYECPDGQLDMSLNIINEDNRLQPIMQPKSILQLPDGYKVIYIHKLNAEDHYIIADRQETNLYWVNTTTQSITQEQLTENSVLRGDDILQITAMGNTLIIRTQYGMRYILWRAATNKYQDLGYGLPDIRHIRDTRRTTQTTKQNRHQHSKKHTHSKKFLYPTFRNRMPQYRLKLWQKRKTRHSANTHIPPKIFLVLKETHPSKHTRNNSQLGPWPQ